MKKNLIFFRHGQGDLGGGGKRYFETSFTHGILGPKLKAWASKLKNNKIDSFNESLYMYKQTKKGRGLYGQWLFFSYRNSFRWV